MNATPTTLLLAETQRVLKETLSVVEAETKAVESANVSAFSGLQVKKRDAFAQLKDLLAKVQNAGLKTDSEALKTLQTKVQQALARNTVVLNAAESSVKRITERYISGLRSTLGHEAPVYSGKGRKDIPATNAPLSINLNETI